MLIGYDNSGGIATGYGMDGRGSIPGKSKRFSSLHSVQTGSGAHPALYPMGAGGSFPRGKKRPEREADQSPPCSAEVKNGGVIYLHSPIRLPSIVLNCLINIVQGELYLL
jgi:hypothetical protein